MTKKGFFMVANDIILHCLPQLGAVGFMLYCTLRRMTDRNDRCYPSLQTLTRMTGIEEPQLKVELDRLERLQLMQRLQHINGLNGKQTEVYLLPLYPEWVINGDDKASDEQPIEPGSQLSLYLERDGISPEGPAMVKISTEPDRVDHPPKEQPVEGLISLITLLVEQMRETSGQMGTLIQRMDRIVEQFPK